MSQDSSVVDLLKYPTLVFSILIALVAAKYFLGLEFGVVTKVGTGGVEFAEKSQATFEALTTLEGKLNQALVQIEALQKAAPGPHADTATVKAELFEAAQTVSDQTARVEQFQLPDPTRKSKLKGYIWIGNYKGVWDKQMLAQLDTGQPAEMPPEKLQPGTVYTALGNMVVRDGLPPNDRDYYKARNSLGVVPRGARIRLVSAPTGIDRETAVQYWAEVEVL